MNLAVGITSTYQRMENLLAETRASIERAGFVYYEIFIDDRLTPFGNWIVGLWRLRILHPRATRYLMLQDDLLACGGLRKYLERMKLPFRGYLNLYTAEENEPTETRQRTWHKAKHHGVGAVALMFDSVAVTKLLSSKRVATWNQSSGGRKGIDYVVSTAMKDVGYVEYVHSPSLVQHVGDHSTLGEERIRRAISFPGEDFDCSKLTPLIQEVR